MTFTSGNDNGVYHGLGFRIDESTSRAIGNMQKNATCESLVNFSGDPEGNVSANPGSVTFDRTNGSAGLYVKVTGTGTTGWQRIQSGNILSPGFYNLGMSIISGTLTIHAQDGTDLSSSNPGYVILSSNLNRNEFVVYELTSNFTIEDTTAGTDLNGALWGTTTSVGWEQNMPIFIYFVSKSDDTNAIPCLARKWWNPTIVRSGDMKVKGSTVPDDEQDFISMEPGITASDYESTSTLNIGYFKITKNSSDNWTFGSLDNFDGIGKFPNRLIFTMPGLQNGATNGVYSSSNGADTIPTFASTGNNYQIHTDGTFSIQYGHNVVNSAGSGTGSIRAHTPYSMGYSSSRIIGGNHRFIDNSSGLYVTSQVTVDTTASAISYVQLLINGNGTRFIQPSDYTTNISNGSLQYRIRGMLGG